MVSFFKGFCIAFSMFSKVPMPQFKWEEKDMKFMIIFFPAIGILIGGVSYLWAVFCTSFSISKLCFCLIGAVIPLAITGGIHIDGYMDTMDALHSYQSKEKKLEILKDAHIGAFSVINLLLYYFVYIAAYSEIKGKRAIILLGAGFWLSRILSGIGLVTFTCAKKDGLLYLFSSQSDKSKVKICLFIQLLLCSVFILLVSIWIGSSMFIVGILSLIYYWYKSKKEFGGITGDTSGCLTTLCEGAFITAIAIGCIFNIV